MKMKQQNFTDIEYMNRKRPTKRDEFLRMMNNIIPWSEWIAYIKPYYFNNKVGRPARGIEIMLRMFLLQAWFTLSDEGIEDSIYDSYAFRTFMNLDFMNEQVPDATTLCNFRKLLIDNDIAKVLFETIKRKLEEHGQMLRGGSVVDATRIEAPSSTKNLDKARDPEMSQTKKGNQYHFGMKAHIGVDAGSGYIHSVTATAANVHDITEAHKLLRDDDRFCYGDSGYIGLMFRDEIINDPMKSVIDYRINVRPSNYRKLPDGYAKDFEKSLERRKSSVRAKVEYAFLLLKKQFGYKKTVYRGIEKNLHRLNILLCSANLLMCARSGGWRTA
jgi:IS5 family transposase